MGKLFASLSWYSNLLDFQFSKFRECSTLSDAQLVIEQNLKFFDFLAEPMADFVYFLLENHGHIKLAMDLLQHIGQNTYSDANEIKSISIFLISLSNKSPNLIRKGLVHLQAQFECSEYSMRCALLHCVGTTVQDLFQSGDHGNVSSLLGVIEERFRDVATHARKKVLQVTSDLLGYKYFYARFSYHWLSLFKLSVGRLQDKNQPVRATAIKTVTQFLIQHPFSLHEEGLNLESVQKRAVEVREELRTFIDEAENVDSVDSNRLTLLETRHTYYGHLLEFLSQLQECAVPHLTQLLSSKNKSEVLDTMEFFVEANSLGIDCAKEGLNKMWHLVFNVRNSEHVNDIHSHIVECFRSVYLSHDDDSIIRELIKLTYGGTLADSTCLEKIIGLCKMQDLISERIVSHLWTIFSAENVVVPTKQRRGATLILSWVYKSQPHRVGSEQLSLILRALRVIDDLELVKHCCAILSCLQCRLPPDAELFDVLQGILLKKSKDSNWYAAAQQVIRTIYQICQQPIPIMNRTIVSLTSALNDERTSLSRLCRLFFVLGHVALQQLVFLEAIESDYKRRKTSEKLQDGQSPSRKKKKTTAQILNDSKEIEELDQVVGTADDLFTENLAAVRELELLSGSGSLLAVFGPIVAHVAQSSETPEKLRVIAATCLAQFMCVSGRFCEMHLLALKSILAKASPELKSNLVIAFGDLVVCWSSLVDDDIHALYDALRPNETVTVKKNALMVLLHLILNGMAKVKGQLSLLAMCLEDNDERIAGLTKLFLSELAGKDQALYNNIGDVLSHLLNMGDDDEQVCESQTLLHSNIEMQPTPVIEKEPSDLHNEAAVLRVLKYLFSFITKDKQAENVIEKLCLRMKDAIRPRQWRTIMYAVSLFSYDTNTEGKLKKLLEHFPCYSDKLHENSVYASLSDVLSKAGKAALAASSSGTNKNANVVFEELQTRVEQARAGFIHVH
jgi:condensin complex subunit 1